MTTESSRDAVEWCRECRDEQPMGAPGVPAEFILWGKLLCDVSPNLIYRLAASGKSAPVEQTRGLNPRKPPHPPGQRRPSQPTKRRV